MEKHLLFLLTKAPYGCSSARESTDAILAACAFGQQVSIVALGDALYQFTQGQDSSDLQMKNTSAMLSSLPMYGVDTIYALASELSDRNLDNNSLVIPATPLDNGEIQALIRKADVVLSY